MSIRTKAILNYVALLGTLAVCGAVVVVVHDGDSSVV